MPPWLPERVPNQVAEFASPRTLTDAQIDLIERWVAQGTPEGDPTERPAVPAWPQGWQLGQPDLVRQMPAAYTLPAAGKDVFRNFVDPGSAAGDALRARDRVPRGQPGRHAPRERRHRSDAGLGASWIGRDARARLRRDAGR